MERNPITRRWRRATAACLLALFAVPWATPQARAASTDHWPQRVLITNDNGIHDDKTWALAKAFAVHSDTWIVAADRNRSGASNYMSLGASRRKITVKRVFHGQHMTAYTFDGYPADCVAFGVLGPLKGDPPDLVVSGINGGPNLGVRSWFGSGTIGAARTAALMGIPAIAVSGLRSSDPAMVTAVTRWVVAFARSPMVRHLKPGQYLTVAIPRVAPDKIRGIRVAPKALTTHGLIEFDRIQRTGSGDDVTEEWVGKATGKRPEVLRGSDEALYREGYIVISPMRLDEQDQAAIPALRTELAQLPPWPQGQR